MTDTQMLPPPSEPTPLGSVPCTMCVDGLDIRFFDQRLQRDSVQAKLVPFLIAQLPDAPIDYLFVDLVNWRVVAVFRDTRTPTVPIVVPLTALMAHAITQKVVE